MDLPADAVIAYVTQTTLSVDDTRGVIAALRARFTNLDAPDASAVRYATPPRQPPARETCKVGARLPVGGTGPHGELAGEPILFLRPLGVVAQ